MSLSVQENSIIMNEKIRKALKNEQVKKGVLFG